MSMDVYNICNNCTWCRERKGNGRTAKMKHTIRAEVPFQKVFIDITRPLPQVNGYKWLLAIVDGFSKWPQFVPLKSKTAEEVFFFENWVVLFGAPEQLHSVRGADFMSEIIKNMCKELNIIKTFTSPYFSQSNGQCKRLFKTIKDMIYCVYKENHYN